MSSPERQWTDKEAICLFNNPEESGDSFLTLVPHRVKGQFCVFQLGPFIDHLERQHALEGSHLEWMIDNLNYLILR